MSGELIDLTLPLFTGAPIWSPEPKTVISDFFTMGENNGALIDMNMKMLYMCGHAGTHCDAPKHLRDGKPSLDEVPLERFVGLASVVHLTDKGFDDPWVMIADLEHLADKLVAGSRLLVHTGWDRFWNTDNTTYFDKNKAPKLHLETLAWLRDRKVGLIGVDMPSVNALLDQHATVFDAEMPPNIIELLTNLDQLPDQVTLICLPLKIQEGDGSPVRAVAIVEEAENG
jgi:kynurenine formamidase